MSWNNRWVDFDSPDFDTVADELYEVVPSEFVAARRAAVARAKEAGDKALAKELGKLKKPTTTGWALNLLVRSGSEKVDELLDLGAALRSAQQALRGDELRSLTNRRAALLSSMTDRAAAEAAERGHPLPGITLREVGQSLAAALSDPEIGADLRRGRMLGAASYSGFGPASLTAVPTPPADDVDDNDRSNEGASVDAARRDARTRVTAAQNSARKAASELEAATERAEKAARRVEELRDALTRAEQESQFADSARRSAEDAARDAAAELTQAQERAAEFEN